MKQKKKRNKYFKELQSLSLNNKNNKIYLQIQMILKIMLKIEYFIMLIFY